MSTRTLGLFTVLVLGLATTGCTSDGPAPGGAGTSASAARAKGGPAGVIDPACGAYVDHTDPNGDHPDIPWDPAVGRSALRCIKIKTGQTVTWSGALDTHRLEAAKGDAPTPIADVYSNRSNTGLVGEERAIATFPRTGTYGFANPADPSMKGAVLVVD